MLRTALIFAAVLLVPVAPLVVLGLSFEEQVEGWLGREWTAAARFALIAGLLATDIVLPIPSSAVSTYGGGILGTWPATAASWLGMTAGAALGFALARSLGPRFAERMAASGDLERMALLCRRFGPAALAVTRALPILAEACVIFVGVNRLSWRRFLPPVVVCNFLVSLVYAAFGEYFRGRDALLSAAIISGTIPLGIALVTRRCLPRGDAPAAGPP